MKPFKERLGYYTFFLAMVSFYGVATLMWNSNSKVYAVGIVTMALILGYGLFKKEIKHKFKEMRNNGIQD